MLNLVKSFLREEDGVQVVEIVVILAVLVTVALIFRKAIVGWVQSTLGGIFEGASEGAAVGSGE